MSPTYAAALAELSRYTNYERAAAYPTGAQGFGTARMERLLARLGSPEQQFFAVHIAGTKGKGSVAYLTEALLRCQQIKTGLYVSPHIQDLRERLQISGEMLSPEKFAEAFFAARAAADPADLPTYFELLTAAAFYAFATAGVKIAVVEVGLGGRLDATNVAGLKAIASAITLIDYDHTQILGETLAAIAAEKAGIIRPQTPVIIGCQPTEARDEILKFAARRGSRVEELDQDFAAFAREISPTGSKFSWRGALTVYRGIELPLCGETQIDNAAVAIALSLQCENFLASCPRETASRNPWSPWSAISLTRAWKNLKIPARIERLSLSPPVILDGAHTEKSAGALVDFLAGNFADFSPKIAIVSLNRDKRLEKIIAQLARFFTEFIATENFSGRAEPAENLGALAAKFGMKASVNRDPQRAWQLAQTSAQRQGLTVITGSFYLAAELRPVIAPPP